MTPYLLMIYLGSLCVTVSQGFNMTEESQLELWQLERWSRWIDPQGGNEALLHCNVYCNGTSRESIVDRSCSALLPRCKPCQCDAACIKYGDCCPVIDEEIKLASKTIFECVGSLDAFFVGGVYGGYFMITDCTKKSKSISQELSPVTSLSANVTYLNKHIASCYGEDSYRHWVKKEICRKSKNKTGNGKLHKSCFITIFPGLDYPVRTCNPLFEDRNYIDECNVTGLWIKLGLDEDLEAECRDGLEIPVLEGNYVFKNIFCFLCNGLTPSVTPCGVRAAADIPSVNSLISVDLQRIQCGYDQWHDFIKNVCRDLHCRSGFELKGDKCEMMEVNLTNIGFSFRADFWPLNNTVPLSMTEVDSLVVNTLPVMMAWLNASDYVFTLYNVVSVENHNSSASSPAFGLYLEFRTNTSCCRLEYENFINDAFKMTWTLQENGSTYDYVIREEDYSRFGIIKSQTYKVTSPDVLPQKVNTYTSLSDILDFPGAYVSFPISLPDCSFVYLTVDDFNWNADESITLEYADIVISQDNFTELHEQRLVICMSMLKELYDQQEVPVDPLRRAESIVSLFFSILSLVCLTLTFITYCTFTSLLTLPTKNTMCLVVFLFLAQFLLQFGGLAKQSDVACKTVGVLIHYFWLCVIFWMNVCSFHMFHVFVIDAAKPITHERNRMRFLRYFIYANGTPAVIVLATITANLVISSGSQIGYGDGRCYLSTALLTGVCFVLPLGIVLILNVIFFGMSVWTMAKISKMSDTVGKDRNQVHIYIKLSTLTGVFWIFSLLAENLHLEVLIFISIILNASQGVFIFISYMANKRILNMWRGKIGKPVTSHTSHTSKETVSTRM